MMAIRRHLRYEGHLFACLVARRGYKDKNCKGTIYEQPSQAYTSGYHATRRTDAARSGSRRPHHRGFHGGQCLLWTEGGTHIRDLDPGRGYLDGGAARLQGHDRPREQHRPDRRLGGRHPLLSHLRAARYGDDRLVDRLSLLGFVCDLCLGRNPGRDVFDSAAARTGDAVRFALSGRSRLRRSAQGRRRRERRRCGCRGQPGRPSGRGLGRDRFSGLRLHRGYAPLRQRRRALLPHRRRERRRKRGA